jgi:photosystem II stability/assembly factor-like uncharacterized protein
MQEDKMKTKFNFQGRGTYRRVLVTLLCQIRYLAAVSLILIAVLLTSYSAIPNARRSDVQDIGTMVDVVPADEDGDADSQDKRHEFLERFFATGAGGVSPSAYARALAAARALPPSPLLQGRRFVSPEAPEAPSAWTSPISPPIQRSYGGNASARVHTLAIDPINANVVYTGSFGGLAKTTDGGVTWHYLSDAWSSQSVSAIVVNPSASNDVYVGTGNSYGPYGVGVYRSLDGGATWSSALGGVQLAGTYIRTIAIDPNASSGPFTTTLYVANGGTHTCGLWRSTDSGSTWTRLHQGSPPSVDDGIYDLAIDSSIRPSTLYVTEDDGTFKSTDSGNSWTRIHDVLEGSRNRLSVVNSTLYLLGPHDADHNLYKSIDHGATWIQVPTRCPCAPDVCANHNPPAPPICADSCANRCGNIGFSVFAVDPNNPQIIVAGNMALYRTDNEGMTWTEIGHWWGPDVHTDQKVIAFSETVPGVVYDGNDGGIVKSTSGGVDWTNLNQNLPGALLYSVALSRDGSMIAGTQDNGAVFSSAGAPWDMIYGGDSNHDLIEPTGTTWAYSVMYTPNSFRRFNRVTRNLENISPAQFIVSENPRTYEPCAFFPTFSMNLSNPTHVIAACQQVVRTVDGPTVTENGWTTIGGSLGINGNYVTSAYEAPSNSNVIYAVRESDTVFVTFNADQGDGAVWHQVTQKNQPGGIYAVTVDPTNYLTAYLACNSGVHKTTDMGTTWTQLGIQNLVYRDVAIDPVNTQHIFAASNAGVFASTDGGLSWGNMSDGIPAGMVVSALSFNAFSRQLAASTFGRGVYMLHLDLPPRPHPTPRPRG